MPPAIAPDLRPPPPPPSPQPNRNPSKGEPPSDRSIRASDPMANPNLGLGLGAPTPTSSVRGGLDASAADVPSAPSRRAPRFAKRRHSASSRARPSPAPWNPFSSASGAAHGGGSGSAQGGASVFGSGANGSQQEAADDVPDAGFASGASVGERRDRVNSGIGNGNGNGVGNLGTGKVQSVDFVFGAGAASRPAEKNIGSSGASAQSSESVETSEPATSGGAPFMSDSTRGCSNLGKNSSLHFEEGSSAKLPDKMRRLNLRSSGKDDVVEQAGQKDEVEKNSNFLSGVDISSLLHNIEANMLPEKMIQLNLGSGMPLQGTESEDANRPAEVFVSESNTTIDFVSGKTTISTADNSSKIVSGASTNASNSVHGTETDVLPEKVTQLNIGRGTPMQSTKSENANCLPEMFIFGSNRTMDSVSGKTTSSTVDNISNFVSGANTSASSSVHGTEANVLPEKITQLNIGRGTPLRSTKSENANHQPDVSIFGSNGTSSFVSGRTASSSMDNASNFLSGANTNTSSLAHGTEANILPEEMAKLNIGHGVLSQSMKSENANHLPEVFVFGSNSSTSFFSGQTASTSSSRTNASSELPNNRKDSTNEDLRNPTSSGVNVDNGYGPSVFVFGSGINSAVQSGGAAANALHDDVKKLSISREGTSAGYTKVYDAPTSVEFSFQSKDETSSRTGAVPQPTVQEACDPVTPSNSSSSFPTFQNGVTDFSFRTMHAGPEAAPREFGPVKQDAIGLSTGSLFGLEHIKTAYRDKKGECKSTRKKKKPTRLKQRGALHQSISKQAHTRESELNSPGDYSPMDCSPYPASAEQVSREASVTSDESIHMYCSSASNQNSSCVEDLVSATEHLVIDGDLPTCEEEGGVHNADATESNFVSSSSILDEETNLYHASQPRFDNADVGINGDTRTAATEAKADYYRSNIEGQTSEENTNRQAHKVGEPFTFASSSTNFSGLNFTFSASQSARSSSSEPKRHWRRKLRTKSGQTSPSPNQSSAAGTSIQPNASQDTKGLQFVPETRRTQDSKKEQVTTDASIAAALEACEMWRIRGNQAYANGHFATAEEHYTRGINSLSCYGTSRRCSHSLMLCYSNRAATRMSLGRMREALKDCVVAVSIDPSFLKAKVRAANCQLALGDIEDASKSYAECLQSNNTASLEPKMLTEAFEGLERAQKVADWTSQSKELLKKRTFNEATRALELISNALFISSHSDNLMEMKAEALLMLRRYEEVIQLCQKTVDLAERNSVLFIANGESKNASDSEKVECPARLWRSCLISKSYFYLGKLEEALELLKKHEQVKPVEESRGSTSPECFSSLSAVVNQLLRLKAAGNEAFQAGRYSEAVEQYSAALSCNSESRPFSAVCFCNRAAAYQALGQVTDAIADCSLAIVLDANYPKAISRRATLYEMTRDYAQAANDLRKLISLLERQVSQSGVSPKVVNSHSDLNRARARLSSVEDEARKETPLNLYLVLGIEPSCSATDVKKAYRKAALRHHPDKAAQLLVRNENADDGFWRDVAKEVYADADHLFKTIGEAYNVLSEPDKRQEYDTEEEIRNAMKRSYNGRSMQRSPEQHYNKHYDKGFSPRQWRRSTNRPCWPGNSDAYW